MAHVNDQIRAALVSALTGLTTTGNRVDEDVLSVKAVTSPRLVVRVETDSVNITIQGLQERTIRAIVTGFVKDGSTLAATLGAIQSEVEVAIQAAGTLGGAFPGYLQLAGDERGIDRDTLEKPVGTIEMSFTGLCYTQAGSPEAFA